MGARSAAIHSCLDISIPAYPPENSPLTYSSVPAPLPATNHSPRLLACRPSKHSRYDMLGSDGLCNTARACRQSTLPVAGKGSETLLTSDAPMPAIVIARLDAVKSFFSAVILGVFTAHIQGKPQSRSPMGVTGITGNRADDEANRVQESQKYARTMACKTGGTAKLV